MYLIKNLTKESKLLINDTLVEDGYANVSTYPPDVKYSDIFIQAERPARENGMGLWK